MKETDIEFWHELTTKKQDLPSPDQDTPEDVVALDEGGEDDSDLTIQTLVSSIVDKNCPIGVAYRPKGGLMSVTDAEVLDDDVDPLTVSVGPKGENEGGPGTQEGVSTILGRGKRTKMSNKQYGAFWRHNDDQGSSDEEWS